MSRSSPDESEQNVQSHTSRLLRIFSSLQYDKIKFIICPKKSYWSLTIFLEPFFFNHAPVTDNADTREPEVLFAVLNQLPQKVSFVVQERLPSREVDLLHA